MSLFTATNYLSTRRSAMSRSKLSETVNKGASTAPPLPEAEAPNVLKAVRELEHDRQRSKRSAGAERNKERKERHRAAVRAVGVKASSTAHNRAAGGRAGAKDLCRHEADERDGSDVLIETSEMEASFEIEVGIWRESDDKPEVDISRLLKPARARKPKADDFEVVPKVRAVIALDDKSHEELEFDEPWEHIPAAGDEDPDGLTKRHGSPSYAEVAATLT